MATWFDQSGSGNNATQPSSLLRPKIYDATTGVVLENGKPAMQLDGTNDFLTASTSDLFGTDFSLFFTHRVTGGSARKFLIETTSTGDNVYNPSLEYSDSTLPSKIRTFSGSAATATATIQSSSSFDSSQRIITVNKNGTTNFELFADGASLGTATPPNVTGMNGYNLGVYRFGNDRYFGGTFQELVIYNSDESANRPSIEDNVGDYYGIEIAGLLDQYSGAAAAYSLRKLSNSYTGFAIKVQDNVGGATQDIGFNADGELDTVALLAYAGSNDVFVETWFDQSGSGNNATQPSSTLRPQIVSSGVVEVDANGKPAVDYDNDVLIAATSATITSESVMIVATQSSSGRWNRIVSQNATGTNDASSYIPCIRQDTTDNIGGFDGSLRSAVAFTYDQQFLFEGYNTGSALTNYVDTVAGTSSSYSLNEAINELRLGNGRGVGAGEYLIGKLQEVIVYHSDQSAYRTGIEANINFFYDIY
mgnify:CR=1 FL=1